MPIPESAVLTYHSFYESIPEDLAGCIHNVTPGEFRDQLLWCKANFDLVGLDSWSAYPSRGRLAITCDDGNETCFSVAIPMLVELGIPATIFLTGSCITGSPGWRDKIRLVMARGWTREFISAAGSIFGNRRFGSDREFFMASKDMVFDSRAVDAALDRFLAGKGDAGRMPIRHREPADGFPIHPLIRYGNHTVNHFVLPSLDERAQAREITALHQMLSALELPVSGFAALPFGRAMDATPACLEALRDTGYKGYLLNGNPGNQPSNSGPDSEGLVPISRMAAPTSMESLAARLSRPACAVGYGESIKVS